MSAISKEEEVGVGEAPESTGCETSPLIERSKDVLIVPLPWRAATVSVSAVLAVLIEAGVLGSSWLKAGHW